MKKLILMAMALALICAGHGIAVAGDSEVDVSVTVHALDPLISEGIELWSNEYTQEIWTHAQGTVTIEDPLTGTTTTRDLTAEDAIGELHIYVTTLEDAPWTLTASSDGFVDAGGDPRNLLSWFFAPPSMDGGLDPGAGDGTIVSGDQILDGGGVTVYTPTADEYKTYKRKTITVEAEDGSGPIEVDINTIYVVGGFAVYEGELVAKGDYATNILLTLVK